jgi:hypothetical protein
MLLDMSGISIDGTSAYFVLPEYIFSLHSFLKRQKRFEITLSFVSHHSKVKAS